MGPEADVGNNVSVLRLSVGLSVRTLVGTGVTRNVGVTVGDGEGRNDG